MIYVYYMNLCKYGSVYSLVVNEDILESMFNYNFN